MILPADGPRAIAAVEAIHSGDVERLKHILTDDPELATAMIRRGDECDEGGNARTLLHVLTDWPGHVPHGVEAVAVLVQAGAHVNARFTGPHTETPLHWAASCDDVDVLDALLDAGADIEARGAVIANGTAMADATAFGQWNAARRLLERGAATTPWEAAALGLMDRVEAYFASDPPPTPDEATAALWAACHGGQVHVAQHLVGRGADIEWVGWDGFTPLQAADRSHADEVVAWLTAVLADGAARCEQG